MKIQISKTVEIDNEAFIVAATQLLEILDEAGALKESYVPHGLRVVDGVVAHDKWSWSNVARNFVETRPKADG